jgi:hypothetical protein
MNNIFNYNDVQEVKNFYLRREKFFELGILVALLVGFFIGLAIN